MTSNAESATDERGITTDDLERIHAYLNQHRYARSVDDLRPSSD